MKKPPNLNKDPILSIILIAKILLSVIINKITRDIIEIISKTN